MINVERGSLPTPEFAGHVAKSALKAPVALVSRFTTGTHHFVFEVISEHGEAVVVRASTDAARYALEGNARLTRALRPLGVPLPAILAQELAAPIPYLILERLPGSDLGQLITSFDDPVLESIAARVAEAQSIVARTPTAGRYGYAVDPHQAQFSTWAEVLEANLARSRRRFQTSGVFSLEIVDKVAGLIDALRRDLNALPAIPFLHDTTTKNVIVTKAGAFSGIVDVDDLCFGDPRYVIALTEAALIAFGGSRHYSAHWLGIANQVDDRLFRLYVSLFLVDFMSEHGQVLNGNQRPLAPDLRQKLIDAFHASLDANRSRERERRGGSRQDCSD